MGISGILTSNSMSNNKLYSLFYYRRFKALKAVINLKSRFGHYNKLIVYAKRQ